MKVFCLFFLLPCLGLAAQEPIAEGRFVKKEKAIEGSFQLRMVGNRYTLILNEDFKTKSGPDLKIIFSPLSFDKINGKNADSRGSLTVSLLTATKGKQTYILPDTFDPKAYNSLLIHCVKYSVLWGGAPLKVN